MSALSIRPAKRSEAKPLVGFYSRSGCGKTLSALLLARGFVGPGGKIAMIETESGRGEVYADDARVLGYQVISIRDNFGPKVYGEGITVAEKAGADALIIDSASHEWEGLGGVLDMAARNQINKCLNPKCLAEIPSDGSYLKQCPQCGGERFDWAKKGPQVWQRPKIDHQKYFMLRLLQTPISLVIVCMRAKHVMEEGPATNKDGSPKMKGGRQVLEWRKSDELKPKQSEDVLFEMLMHGWIDEKHLFHGTKYTRPEQREALRDGELITVDTGRALAEWAKGETPSPALAKALKSIAGAKTMAALEKVGAGLKGAGLKGAELKRAKAAYKTRGDNLKRAK